MVTIFCICGCCGLLQLVFIGCFSGYCFLCCQRVFICICTRTFTMQQIMVCSLVLHDLQYNITYIKSFESTRESCIRVLYRPNIWIRPVLHLAYLFLYITQHGLACGPLGPAHYSFSNRCLVSATR